ncbi:MAG: hypothetical protein ND866_00180 [Pyrinomonadaceae bacterium]|nr:hypothetical protein [Pyrinomonadaceae bacterium]
MNKPIKALNEPGKPTNSPKPRTVRVAALLNTATALGAVLLVAAMSGPKRPLIGGD